MLLNYFILEDLDSINESSPSQDTFKKKSIKVNSFI